MSAEHESDKRVAAMMLDIDDIIVKYKDTGNEGFLDLVHAFLITTVAAFEVGKIPKDKFLETVSKYWDDYAATRGMARNELDMKVVTTPAKKKQTN